MQIMRYVRKKHLKFTLGLVFSLLVYLVYKANILIRSIESNPKNSILTSIYEENETMACVLPQLNPFDPSMMKFVIKYKYHPRCNSHQKFPLIFSTDMNNNLFAMNSPEKFGFHNCCYTKFSRKNEDSNEISSNCHKLNLTKGNFIKIPSDHEFIAILCHRQDKNSSTKLSVVDSFTFFPLKSEVEKRIQKIERNTKNTLNLSVIILGIDSTSHMNLKRTMPNTLNYLTHKISGIGMNGFTKIGYHTFPNIMGVLTGLTTEELIETCWKARHEFLDECPFIWKQFSVEGYRTAYAEDSTIGAFNSLKAGYDTKPTDYYFRPSAIYQQEYMVHGFMNGPFPVVRNPICSGPRYGIEFLIDNLKKMAWTMGKKHQLKKYFQFQWSLSMTHDDFNYPQFLDKIFHSTLKFLKTNGFLNHSVLILMSDHGFLTSPEIRIIGQGQIEASMPFMYFIFPEWFSTKYPRAFKNFNRNSNLLTTGFDVHETLLDLIKTDETIVDEKIWIRENNLQNDEKFGNLSRGISLFLPIPKSRTCSMAGIINQWCMCNSFDTILINQSYVSEAAMDYIQFLNKILKPYKKCSKLELKEIKKVQTRHIINHGYLGKVSTSVYEFIIILQTIPGNGMFETTMVRDMNGNWTMTSDDRINLYGSQSHCVEEPNMKKYCYCKDFIKKKKKKNLILVTKVD